MAQLNPLAQAMNTPAPLPAAFEPLQQCSAPAALGFRRIAELLDDFTAIDQTIKDKFMVKSDVKPDSVVSCLPTVQDRPAYFNIMLPLALETRLDHHWHMQDLKDVLAYPRHNSNAEVMHAISVLISRVRDALYRGTSTTITFHVPRIRKIARPSCAVSRDPGVLRDSVTERICMMPCGSDMPFWCSRLEDCLEIHLAVGLLVYFIWPPGERNLSLVRSYFDNPTISNYLNVCERLEGGMTLVQQPDQIVHLPPFCLTVAFATSNSTTIIYRYRKMDGLRVRLQYAGLLSKQSFSIQNPFRGPTTLESQIARLGKELEQALLQFVEAPLKPLLLSHVATIAVEWDWIKSPFRGLIEQHASLQLKESIFEGVAQAWWQVTMAFCQAFRHKTCSLCHEQAQSDWASFRRHFAQQHWFPIPSGGVQIHGTSSFSVAYM